MAGYTTRMKHNPRQKPVLLILDANSLIHRAFHALPPLSTSRGEQVNALYGFFSILLKAIKEFQPEYIAVCFDMKAPTLRKQKYVQYKAKRERAADELYNQIPLVKEGLEAMDIPLYEQEGFEADDLIGTVATLAPRLQILPPLATIIVSGDQDVLQLVNKNTKVYMAKQGVQSMALFDEKMVRERFDGLFPLQLPDYKGLRGDSSDNLPGVKGIGEKTAISLLKEFKSLPHLYEVLKSGKATGVPERVQDLLREHEAAAFVSWELGTITRDVPIEISLDRLRWEKNDLSRIQEFLSRMEFSSLIKRLPVSLEKYEDKRSKKEKIRETIERLRKEEVLSKKVYELEKNLIPIVLRMEEQGICVDQEHFKGLAKEITKEIARLEQEIYQYAGEEFNINSSQQLSRILFEELEVSSVGLKRTPKKAISTAASELEKLRQDHPIINPLLEYRELQKMHSTYINTIPHLADEHNRVHTSFDQLGTATGRMASANPNMQNIPLRGEWGKRIRQGFVAEKGWFFVALDYSQFELRIAAHLSQDKEMQGFFLEGKDIHRETASAVFRVSSENVTDEMRFKAKALNFGILYGMGASGFSKSANISLHEAKEFIEQYFERFPGIASYIEKTKEFAREYGYTETMLGRRRYLPDIHSKVPQFRSAAEREAVNHPIQGTQADLIKMAMVRIGEEVLEKSADIRLLLQIHDELLFEVRDREVDRILPVITNIMTDKSLLLVPIEVHVSRGANWGEMEKG
ncbi:MAG: DNA polymerase [bacterium]|nr:DNA polymerase [bacterium]